MIPFNPILEEIAGHGNCICLCKALSNTPIIQFFKQSYKTSCNAAIS